MRGKAVQIQSAGCRNSCPRAVWASHQDSGGLHRASWDRLRDRAPGHRRACRVARCCEVTALGVTETPRGRWEGCGRCKILERVRRASCKSRTGRLSGSVVQPRQEAAWVPAGPGQCASSPPPLACPPWLWFTVDTWWGRELGKRMTSPLSCPLQTELELEPSIQGSHGPARPLPDTLLVHSASRMLAPASHLAAWAPGVLSPISTVPPSPVPPTVFLAPHLSSPVGLPIPRYTVPREQQDDAVLRALSPPSRAVHSAPPGWGTLRISIASLVL